MPGVVSNQPNLANSLRTDSPDEPNLYRRDSRLIECQMPIAEEDESTETASEPAEPVTPTSHNSDNTPFSHPFRNDEPVDSVFVTPASTLNMKDFESKPLPHPPAPAPPSRDAPAPPTPIARTKSNLKSNPQTQPQPEQQASATPERGTGTFKRAASFVRGKLHRNPSQKDAPNGHLEKPQADQQEKPKTPQNGNVKTDKLIVKTGVDGPAEVSTPAVNIPRYGRRLSSFSLSARNSPKSSQANSPPSPGSPSSTISNEQAQGKAKLGHKHSSSSTALSSMNKQRNPGITWANGGRAGKKHTWSRRRSASTEQVPRMESDEEKPTAGMLATFSKPAAEGVGMKARRLSLSLPDEFIVDSCELDKEFKSSSLMPGRRGKVLGKGATAEVRIMARKGFGHEDLVAVKEFRDREKDESKEDYIKKIKSEYSIAKSLHHPNIVETVRLCTNRSERWNHVMEYCAHGELFSLVERKLFAGGTDGYYSPDDRLCFFKQLLRGVDYLHSHGIAHRDIKLENLLLNKDGHLKISDFGVAEVFSGEHPGLRAAGGECGKNMGEVRLSAPGICGSLPYIAPEVLEKKGSYDPRPLDVWSCAIVYLTMTFGGCPWQAAKTEFEYYARFRKGWDEWLKNHPEGRIVDGPDGHPKCGKLFSLINPPAIKRLMLKMLHPIPDKRITIREVLESPCVKNINCCCPENYEDPKCCVDAAKGRPAAQVPMMKKYLHHHIPPKPESKIGKALTHRFDMGDGW